MSSKYSSTSFRLLIFLSFRLSAPVNPSSCFRLSSFNGIRHETFCVLCMSFLDALASLGSMLESQSLSH